MPVAFEPAPEVGSAGRVEVRAPVGIALVRLAIALMMGRGAEIGKGGVVGSEGVAVVMLEGAWVIEESERAPFAASEEVTASADVTAGALVKGAAEEATDAEDDAIGAGSVPFP